LVGVVASIRAVKCRYEFPYGGSPVDGSGILVSVTRATSIDPLALDLDERITIGYVAAVDLLEPIEAIPFR
jgi:hypothetical protein